jgi:hypothetical protein
LRARERLSRGDLHRFLDALQADARAGDRAAVAARIRYPATVRIGGLRVPFADAAALLERYDDIFTPALLRDLPRHVFVEQIGGEWKITSITVPAPQAADPAEPATTGPAAPNRVGIRGGPRPTQFAGAVRPGSTDIYLLWVPKGRVLEVRLTRVQGRAALLRVVHAKTGAPLNPRITGEARVVTGLAPESADYRIGGVAAVMQAAAYWCR